MSEEQSPGVASLREALRSKDMSSADRLSAIGEKIIDAVQSYSDMIGGQILVDPIKSTTTSRMVMALREVAAIISKQHEMEMKDDLNTRGSKFQVAISWFMDLVEESLKEAGATEPLMNTYYRSLGLKLQGWEDLLELKLKGSSLKAAMRQQEYSDNITLIKGSGLGGGSEESQGATVGR